MPAAWEGCDFATDAQCTDAVASLQWLRVPEIMVYKVTAVLTCEVLSDISPRYLGPLVRIADVLCRPVPVLR